VGGCPRAPPLERAIAEIAEREDREREGSHVGATRASPSNRSPRSGNPRVVAVTRLDRNIRVVPGPPPPLGVKELDSPQFTESAPEIGAEEEVEEEQALDLSPYRKGSIRPMELVEVIME